MGLIRKLVERGKGREIQNSFDVVKSDIVLHLLLRIISFQWQQIET